MSICIRILIIISLKSFAMLHFVCSEEKGLTTGSIGEWLTAFSVYILTCVYIKEKKKYEAPFAK